jgi:hypothetical protein
MYYDIWRKKEDKNGKLWKTGRKGKLKGKLKLIRQHNCIQKEQS